MAIVAREPESKFTPAPEGLHQAVCVDVVELGVVKGPYGDKEKVEIVWQIDLTNEDTNRRFEVRKWYTISLHEKANLRKDLECWRGRKFTKDELAGFDLEKLIGANCQLQVIHNITDEGKVYANVQAIVPHNSKVPKIAPDMYIRKKDRPTERGNGNTPDDPFVDDDAPPF